MGNAASVSLSTYRFLGQVITQSTRIDPRHLEHFTYTYWNGELANLILTGNFHSTLLGPQFPIWVSPKEDKAQMDPDASFVSAVSVSDGEAQGVYVDFALIMPIIQPRDLEDFGDKFVKAVKGKSLRDVLENILPKEIDIVGPRCFWVSGFEAPLLEELKPGPSRHPKNVQSYISTIQSTFIRAQTQAEEQALCLFCSWRFATQNAVVLIAGVGWYYRIKVVTRGWAEGTLNGRTYSTKKIKQMKREEEMNETKEVDVGEDSESDDGEKEEDMYGDPSKAMERQAKINNNRRQRLERYTRKRAILLQTQSNKPNHADRSAPLFPAEDLDLAHAAAYGSNFFEHGSAASYFVEGAESSKWSGVFTLGDEKSDGAMEQIKVFVREMETREDVRRQGKRFGEHQ